MSTFERYQYINKVSWEIGKTGSQFIISILLIVGLVLVCFFLIDITDHHIVALILLLAVSILAVSFDMLPVMVAAFLSALLFNVFFMYPILNYRIDNTESALLFFIYLFIALVSAVLTNRLRKQEKKNREREEKENTIRLYNTLLNSLSHELKTPIATIIGMVDTLKDKDTYIGEAQRNELLSEIESAGIRLNYQVENLLNMSRLESGKLQLKRDWCDINELIFMIIEKIPDHREHELCFEPDENLPLFKLDSGLLEPALYAIINNAILYTPINTRVLIEVEYRQSLLRMVIKDTGQGIPSDKFLLVFEKFYRLPNSGTGGTGLGLSIAKGVVEAHQGRIYVFNSERGGAVFTLEIPIDEVSNMKTTKNE